MKNKKHSAVKGNYGYLRIKRNHVIIQTTLFFAIALGIFATGYAITRDRNNLFTIVSILACLPACRSMVSMIMYFRAKGCSESARDAIAASQGSLVGMYDMFFTSYRENFAVSHMIVKNKVIAAFTEAPVFDVKAFKEHLSAMLKQGGIQGITVSVSTSIEKYCEQLKTLNEKEPESSPEKEDEVRSLLYDISL